MVKVTNQPKQYVMTAMGTTKYLKVLTKRKMVDVMFGCFMPGRGLTLMNGKAFVLGTASSEIEGAAIFSLECVESAVVRLDSIKSLGYSVSGRKKNSSTRMTAKRMAVSHWIQTKPARSTKPPIRGPASRPRSIAST